MKVPLLILVWFLSKGWTEIIAVFEVSTKGWSLQREGSLFALCNKWQTHSQDNRDNIASYNRSRKLSTIVLWLEEISELLTDQAVGSDGVLCRCYYIDTSSVWWVSMFFNGQCIITVITILKSIILTQDKLMEKSLLWKENLRYLQYWMVKY